MRSKLAIVSEVTVEITRSIKSALFGTVCYEVIFSIGIRFLENDSGFSDVNLPHVFLEVLWRTRT